jgi:hypothetical protein
VAKQPATPALSAGTALFAGLAGRTDFHLLGTQVFKSGSVMLRLDPLHLGRS